MHGRIQAYAQYQVLTVSLSSNEREKATLTYVGIFPIQHTGVAKKIKKLLQKLIIRIM